MRRLAALIRSGEAPRRALTSWHAGSQQGFSDALRRIARRLRLGDDAAGAVASLGGGFGADADNLALLFAITSECGGDLAALIERAAVAIDDRAKEEAFARASAAGAILSARMVAVLPLLCLPLLPISRAPFLDAPGLAMLVSGVALAVGGLWWIDRLVPVPPDADPVATLAEVVANVLMGGVELRRVLDRISVTAPGEAREPFARAARMVALGSTWPEALAMSSHEDVRALGFRMVAAQRLGVPVADALRLFAADLRAVRRRTFDERARRAPVLMVLPLVLCVLPSFLLLALGPFVRGLSIT
ncbi:MAG TPA: type II secretion system F family protein [Actinomycetota bacterium]|nr:type II secretion system F family protein [Actinomycetota bacterium]